VNGNLVSGFGTNAVEIQWGNMDTGYINISMSRQVCEKTNKTIVLLNQITTGVSKVTQTRVKAYPNPAYQQLMVEAKGNFVAEVYSIVGRKVMVKQATDTGILDLTALPEGIYTVLVTCEGRTDLVRITKR